MTNAASPGPLLIVPTILVAVGFCAAIRQRDREMVRVFGFALAVLLITSIATWN